MAIKLFIGGFPLDMDEMALAQLVGLHGTIEVMKIVRDKKTRTCKGYAFLEMATESDARAVIAALNGLEAGDRRLTVKLADEPSPVPAPAKRYERLTRPGEPAKAKRPRRPSGS